MLKWLRNIFRSSSHLQEKGFPPAIVGMVSSENAIAHKKMGDDCLDQGEWAKAAIYYEQAIAINPEYSEAHNNLALTLFEQGQFDGARARLKLVISLKPDSFNAYYMSGMIGHKLGKIDEAIACLSQALCIKSDFAEALDYLGILWRELGAIEASIDCFRKALAINPLTDVTHSSLLFSLQCSPLLRQEERFAEHLRFAEHFEAPLTHFIRPHNNNRDVNRRLRIGYVSPDFRRHSVAHFMLPILVRHDKTKVEIFCYFNFAVGDEITDRIVAAADKFVFCSMMSDEQLAEQIRADSIDILVDLAGHTGNNRLLTFARKPAPIQISYLGYVDTTGLSTMDYRLTNDDADPVGNDRYYSERLYRFQDHLWWAFRPAGDLPEVSPLPASINGFVTFCSNNQIAKISLSMMDAWAKILLAVPDSRLVLMGIADTSARASITARFIAQGVDHERLSFHHFLPLDAFRRMLLQADICLDTFPFNGGTTTCETLALGLPFVTLTGQTFASRVGFALLKAIGLVELSATSYDDYVRIATALAGNPERMAALRSGMRARLAVSPLFDEAGFTSSLEKAYREMWVRYVSEIRE